MRQFNNINLLMATVSITNKLFYKPSANIFIQNVVFVDKINIFEALDLNLALVIFYPLIE